MNRRHWVALLLIGALGLNLVAGFVLAHFISSSYIWGYVVLWAMLNVFGVVCVTRRSKTLTPQNHFINTIPAALDLAQQGQWGQVEGLVGSRITAQLAARITPQGNHRGNGQPRGSSERKQQFVMSIEKIQQSTQALEVVSSKTKELFNHLNRAGQLAGGAQSRVDQGQTVLSDNVEAMAAISTSFKRMKEVIGVIDGIAFKTNLLALNAAVEAARAGDAGLGFAVVAEEVRALARSAAQEAQKTQELIGSTLDRVIRGESLVKEARQAFQELSDTSVELGTIVSLVQSDSSALGHGLDRQNFEIMTSTARAKEMVKMSNGAAGGSPTICRFRPQWVPQSQFAGYYVAFEKGFFAEEGVQIEMLDGGPDTNPMSELLRGEIEFGTTWMAPSLIMASQGADLVLLSQVFHRNGLLLVTLKEKGFETIDNLKGCNIGVWGGEFNYPVQALDRERGLGFVYVQQGFDMSELLEGKVDAALSMGFNEMFSFDDKGVDRSKLKIFRFEDLGLKLPEDGIYTTRRFLNKNPQACAAFVNASLKGWRYAMANPGEAVEMVMAHAARSPFPTTREHQQRMLDEILCMVKDSLQSRGNLNEPDFQNAQEALAAIGQIDQKVDYEKFFHVGT